MTPTFLPSLLRAATDDGSERDRAVDRGVRAAAARGVRRRDRPLLVFDQFEELVTLFERRRRDASAQQRHRRRCSSAAPRPAAGEARCFVFREDYLGKVKQLLAACPELVDQALRLAPPAADALPTIIRGPFERYPGHFARELSPELAERLRAALAERFGAGELSLSEVQTVCLRLWQRDDPEALLAEKGVKGLLEDYLGEALDAFPPDLRCAGGRAARPDGHLGRHAQRISAETWSSACARTEPQIRRGCSSARSTRLERESRLVRRERRRDLDLYEITSEFLVPWISRRRDELRQAGAIAGAIGAELLVLGSIAAALLLVRRRHCSRLGVHQRNNALTRRERQAGATAATHSRFPQQRRELKSRSEVSLLLALAANNVAHRRGTQRMTAALGGPSRQARAGSCTATGQCQRVAFSPDGQHAGLRRRRHTVRLWDAATRPAARRAAQRPHGRSTSVAFSPDGRTLASASGDGTVRLWDVAQPDASSAPPSPATPAVRAWRSAPTARRSPPASDDGTVRLWDVATRPGSAATARRPHRRRSTSVAFSPDGSTLASASDDRHGAAVGRRTPGRLGHAAHAATPARSQRGVQPRRQTLASAGDDGRSRLWDVGHAAARSARRCTGHTGGRRAAWRSAPTARRSPPAATTDRAAVGRARRGRQLGPPLTGHTGVGRRAWRSAPTAQRSPPPARTARCGCGTSRTRPASSARRSTATPATCERGVQPRRPARSPPASDDNTVAAVGRARPAPPARAAAHAATPARSCSVAFSPDGKHARLRRATTARCGCGTSRTGTAASARPHRPHRRCQQRGVQPRRHDARLRQLRRRRSSCGTSRPAGTLGQPLTGHTD